MHTSALLIQINRMDDEKEYLSKEKFDELNLELERLRTVERKEIAKSLEFAKSLGDLSENAEYQEARESQARLEERIAKIKIILKHAVIIKSHHSSVVELGSTVVIQKEGSNEKKRFQIVGTEEADLSGTKVSHQSPIGGALLGKEKGDTAHVKTAKGEVKYHILEIE